MEGIANWLVGIGTLAVAVLAIWGDWFRSILAPPKLNFCLYNIQGTVTNITEGPRVIYYHLKVINSRPWFLVKNCQVRLVGISFRGPDGRFKPLGNPVPPTFVWSPAGIALASANISKEQIFDFGRVVEGSQIFAPVLYFYPNNFEGRIAPNQTARYILEAVADNVMKTTRIVIEVAWNGVWTDNLDVMSRHLTIREVQP